MKCLSMSTQWRSKVNMEKEQKSIKKSAKLYRKYALAVCVNALRNVLRLKDLEDIIKT